MEQESLTQEIIGCAIRVHQVLGLGFLESVYQNALLIELRLAGLHCEPSARIPVQYRGEIVGDFIVDILVDNRSSWNSKRSMRFTRSTRPRS
jgi:GxxExxY protein